MPSYPAPSGQGCVGGVCVCVCVCLYQNLPFIIHLLSFFIVPEQSQAQQSLFTLVILQSLFPWLWFCWIVGRDIGTLVHPFMHVTNQIMRHLTTLRESQLLPSLICASLNFFTLTFRGLGRNHIVLTPILGLHNPKFSVHLTFVADLSILLIFWSLEEYVFYQILLQMLSMDFGDHYSTCSFCFY